MTARKEKNCCPEPFTSSQLAQLRRRLLSWFRRNQRDLPWRQTRDPYAIWVSEVMLQQTQVTMVIPYFERFLRLFPSIRQLAAADEQDVLRCWEGLGYYRRARDLHRAARILVAEHGGRLPDAPDKVRRLPGFGRYTTAAVLSQTFDRRLPIVEANTQRLLCRLFAVREDPRRGAVQRRLWELADSLLPRHRSGEFNQALMELGALVCTPAASRCPTCPLAGLCRARREGIHDELPVRSASPRIEEVAEAAVVVRRRGHVLLVQRPAHGRWPGMWEFPHAPVQEGETHDEAAGRLLRELTGLRADLGPELLTIRHGVTRFRITLVVLEAQHRGGEFRSHFYAQCKWLTPAELADYPVSAPQRRVARALTEARQPRLF